MAGTTWTDLCKIKPDKITAWIGGGTHGVPHLAEKLLTVDAVEEGALVFFKDEGPKRQPMNICIVLSECHALK